MLNSIAFINELYLKFVDERLNVGTVRGGQPDAEVIYRKTDFLRARDNRLQKFSPLHK